MLASTASVRHVTRQARGSAARCARRDRLTVSSDSLSDDTQPQDDPRPAARRHRGRIAVTAGRPRHRHARDRRVENGHVREANGGLRHSAWSAAASAGAAAATPATTAGSRAAAGSHTADCHRGQQLDRVIVALRAGARVRGLAHRAGKLERVAARAAPVLVSRHIPMVRGRLVCCPLCLAPPGAPGGRSSSRIGWAGGRKGTGLGRGGMAIVLRAGEAVSILV